MGRPRPGRCLVIILLGIAGRLAGFYAPDKRAGLIAAMAGADAVLAVHRVFARRR